MKSSPRATTSWRRQPKPSSPQAKYMTQRPATQEEAYLAASESFESNGAARDPAWARDLRKAAIAKFRDLGFPTARRGNEEWKYTDVGPIARLPLQPAPHAPQPAAADVAQAGLGEPGWPQIVFVNGHYDGALSSTASLPAGVTVTNLSEAMQSSPDLVRQSLARHADYESNAFTALNTAFVHEGAFVHVPDGAQVEDPIRLLFLTTSGEQGTVASSPRPHCCWQGEQGHHNRRPQGRHRWPVLRQRGD